MPTDQVYPPDDSAGSRAANGFRLFLRALLRLLVIAIGLGILAAVFYVGLPYLYRQLILPVRDHTTQIAQIQARQAEAGDEVSQRMEALQQKIGKLEAQTAADADTISELKDRLAAAEEILTGQPKMLERLSEAESRLDSTERGLREEQQAAQAMEKRLAGPNSPIASLSQQIEIVKAMQTLVRARFFLEQNNPGLAMDEIGYAQGILVSLQPDAAGDQKPVIDAILQRLDLAAGNLPAYPVLAAADLEIAWQMLIAGPGGNASGGAAASLTSTATPSSPTPTAAASTQTATTPTARATAPAATPTPKP